MKPNRYIKCIAIFLVLGLVISMTGNSVMAADPTVLQPPARNRVTDIGYIQNVNTRDWYAQLNWDAMTFPPEADERYIYLGFNEVAYGTGRLVNDALMVALPGGATGYDIDSYIPEGIKHGTIYETYVRAMYRSNTPTGQYTVNSQKSSPAKFLTGLHVSVELVPGTNNIKIKWDDVWDTTGRINYRILISDTKGFTQPPAIPDIVASEIGKADSAVTVNRDEKKLEYIYTNALPGREYSIKVVPIPSPTVACATVDEIDAISIKTDILLKAQRVGYTNEGDVIWKLFWNPIVKGSIFTRVDYELYRYTDSEPQGQLYRLIPDQDSYLITVKKDDPVLYSFKIDAKAYVQGSDAPIEFRSNNKVMLIEQIPQQPEAPDFVESFIEADPNPIYFDDLLTSNSATLLWRAPFTGYGTLDHDITYDVYLLEDIRDITNPPSNYRIGSDISMGAANEVRSRLTGEVIGYRYNLTGLESNTTYYFVIYAKKSFLVEKPDEGIMVTMPYISKQAVKVISTRPDKGTDRPIAPSAPPFGLKDSDSVTETGATMVLDKKWHALYNSETKRWEYSSKEEYENNGLLDATNPDKKNGMVVNYLPGWKVVPHVVRYNDALNVIRLRNNRAGEYVTYSDLSQADIKAFEIAQQTVVVPSIPEDADEQTFNFNITGLTHNTAYLVWVTIENQNGLTSDPSDPIVITTPPQIPDRPVTPTVPTDLRGIAADSFVDLFWTYTLDMDYEIKAGTSDKVASASITKRVSYDEIRRNTFTRIEGLEPNTIYYFWIKAISKTAQGQPIESVFSNPLVIRTEAYRPPAPPTGFGVKTGPDGVTEKSITYLWDAKEGFAYYLEFADNADFENATMISVSGGSHTVTNLVANRRYYARLYAYENKTKLRSEPTRTIMVVTNKTKSEYDGSFDLDDVVTGDGLNIPSKLENGVWTISSLGAHAHVLGERIRNQYGAIVKLDLSEPPGKTSTIRLELGAAVFDVLSELKKELYVKLPWGQYLIRPGTFQNDEYFKQKSQNSELSYRLETVSPATQYKADTNMQLKTPITALGISYLSSNAPVNKLVHSIRMELPIAGLGNYGQGQIKTYATNVNQGWYALPTYTDYVNSQVLGELDKPGAVAAATWGVQTVPSVPAYITESVARIQSVYKLTSLEGKTFNAGQNITQKALLKLIMDVVDPDGASVSSDEEMLDRAIRAGLIQSANDVTDAYARRDKAASLLASLYRFKTRESTQPTRPSVWSRYQDLSKSDGRYLESFKFALENGIILGNGVDYAYPDKIVTYGDFLVMLERLLKLCGEL